MQSTQIYDSNTHRLQRAFENTSGKIYTRRNSFRLQRMKKKNKWNRPYQKLSEACEDKLFEKNRIK